MVGEPALFRGMRGALQREHPDLAVRDRGDRDHASASTFFFMMYPKYGLSIFQVPGIDCWLLCMVLLAASGFIKPGKMDELEKPAPMNEV